MEFIYEWGGYISIFLLFFLMLLTVPVFVAMGFSAFIASLLLEDPLHVFLTFIQTSWQGVSIFELVALPLFILTGTIMQRTDAGRDLFAVTKA
jgi:C4-dicarboxylate transporter DctM subunit